MSEEKIKRKRLQVGEQIAQLRAEKGLSLEALSRSLCVRVETLEALEKGEVSRLPPRPYVMGLLRALCPLLEIEFSSLALGDYYAQTSKKAPRAFFKSRRDFSFPLLVIASVVFIGVIGITVENALFRSSSLLPPSSSLPQAQSLPSVSDKVPFLPQEERVSPEGVLPLSQEGISSSEGGVPSLPDQFRLRSSLPVWVRIKTFHEVIFSGFFSGEREFPFEETILLSTTHPSRLYFVSTGKPLLEKDVFVTLDYQDILSLLRPIFP